MCLKGYSGGVGLKLLQGLLLTNMFWGPEEAQVGRLKWFSFKMLWMSSLHHWWWWKAESGRHCAAAGSWHWRCGYKRNKISTKGKHNTRKLEKHADQPECCHYSGGTICPRGTGTRRYSCSGWCVWLKTCLSLRQTRWSGTKGLDNTSYWRQ